jgi:thiol-disulfide isomerase/thioredoxin
LRGRVVYVDFWASWCVPCRASFPWLAKLNERYAARGLTIVAIDLDKDRAAADAFLAKYAAPFKVAFDAPGKTAEAFGVEAMPTSFLIGRDGRVLERHAGFDAKHAAELGQGVAGRTMHLRHAAQAVGVLDLVAAGRMRRADLAAIEELAQVPGGRDLPGVRTGRDELFGEGGRGAEHRLQAHCADDVRDERQALCVVEGQRADAGHELRPVEQGEPFLGLERQRREAGTLQRIGSRAGTSTIDGRLTLADEHERDVRQRRQVAGSPEAAARGDDGVHGRVQHADEQLDDLDAHAG